MAATSPYSANDYQAVSNFRPYELPINDIFKAISAQNQFWDAGAARVKSVYDNALGLKLSKEQNQEIRRKYMEDAEKQLSKLSTMDLGDPSVQRKGFALFKPLFKDEGILFDDLATRHYEKVRNDALTYRNKDNGKQYSDINTQYAMQGYKEFLASPDRMAGKSAYENRREYEPFYDYTEDFAKALKDCPASSIETQSPMYGKDNAMTGYMVNTYVKSRSTAQAKGCLEANLNPKAARQLQIEGSVNYKNNPDVLASDTATYLSGVSANLSEKLQSIHAKRAALQKDPRGLSVEELAAVNKQMDEEAKAITEELDRTNHSVNKLNAGDYTDMLNNFDNYAGSVYAWKKLYKKALSATFEEQRQKTVADPVQMSAIRFTQEKYLNQLDFSQAVSLKQMDQEFDREMKMLDLMYGNSSSSGKSGMGADVFRNPLTGEVTINPNLMRETGVLHDKPEADSNIYEKLSKQVSDLGEQDANNNLRLYNNIMARAERDKPFRETLLKGFNWGTSDTDWTSFKVASSGNRFTNGATGQAIPFHQTAWFKAYTAENPKDEDVNKWANDHMVINVGINTLNRKLEIGEKQVADELGGDFRTKINQGLTKFKPVTSTSGITITPYDIQSTIEGKPVKGLAIEKIKVTRDVGNRGEVEKEETVVKVNGKVDGRLTQLYQSVKNENESITSKLRKKRVEVYNQLGFDREAWYFTPNEKAPLVETLKSILPKVATSESGAATKDADVKIISSDFSGGVKVSIPGVKKGEKNIVKMIGDAGVGTSVEAVEDGIVIIRGTTHNLVQQAINNPVLGQAAYQLQSIAETTAFAQTQDGAKVPNADITLPVYVSGKMKAMTIETYKNGGRPEYRVYMEGSPDPRPKAVASNAYDLFEKIGRLPIDLNKPIQ